MCLILSCLVMNSKSFFSKQLFSCLWILAEFIATPSLKHASLRRFPHCLHFFSLRIPAPVSCPGSLRLWICDEMRSRRLNVELQLLTGQIIFTNPFTVTFPDSWRSWTCLARWSRRVNVVLQCWTGQISSLPFDRVVSNAEIWSWRSFTTPDSFWTRSSSTCIFVRHSQWTSEELRLFLAPFRLSIIGESGWDLLLAVPGRLRLLKSPSDPQISGSPNRCDPGNNVIVHRQKDAGE